MAYTNVWNDASPTGAEAANTIDDIFRSVKVDLEQRFIDIFNMANFTADPLRPGGLKFYDTADAKLFFGNNAGTPWGINLRDKADTTTYTSLKYTGIVLTPPTLTGASTPYFQLTQTWNNGATTFVGELINITSTASAAASLFFDYQLASVSQWKVSKSGVGTLVGILTAGGFAGPLTGNVTGNLTGAVIGTTVSASTSLAIAATSIFYLDGVAATGDTYIYESSANTVRLFAGGNAIWQAQATLIALYRDTALDPLKKFYLDGGGDTYLLESAANVVTIFANSATAMVWNATSVLVSVGGAFDFSLGSTKKLFLDGGSDTYLKESSANVVELFAGGVSAMVASASGVGVGTSGNRLWIDGGGDTYLIEDVANRFNFTAGGTSQAFWVGAAFASILPTNRFYLDGGGDTYLYEDTGNRVTIFTGGSAAMGISLSGTYIPAAAKFWLDGGGNTYLIETSADIVDLFAGGSQISRWATNQFALAAGMDLVIQPTTKLRLDGTTAGDSFLYERTANVLGIVAGGVTSMEFIATGVYIASANKFWFDGVGAAGDTYMYESSANVLDVYAGGQFVASFRNNYVFLQYMRFNSGTLGSPQNGDFWFDATNLFFRLGAVTKTITWT